MVAIPFGSGLFSNQNQPQYVTNSVYLPQGFYPSTSSLSTTATRCYYLPIAIARQHTFQGAQVFNQGVGDNGEKCRIMVFRDADGGPGALEKDFGEITFTAASALRTLSSSWAASPGIYWLAQWYDSATVMYVMQPYFGISNVGAISGFSQAHAVGSMDATYLSGGTFFPAGFYVDTTYGAAPATAVAPTASISFNSLSNTQAQVPTIGLKA